MSFRFLEIFPLARGINFFFTNKIILLVKVEDVHGVNKFKVASNFRSKVSEFLLFHPFFTLKTKILN